jgi:uncharacterized protein (DUF2235 family)
MDHRAKQDVLYIINTYRLQSILDNDLFERTDATQAAFWVGRSDTGRSQSDFALRILFIARRSNMADGPRDLIVLSDGTGNSASTPFKTNVWRLYQAVDLTDGTQVAVFGDGVGTSSVKILRVLGLALGVGVKRNVLNLYKFLCRNYNSGDRIWAFGFSRGAFTIRVLVGLIHHEGLVSFVSEAELNRNALAAYRAYRQRAFQTVIPWVAGGRLLRDQLISLWNVITGARSYAKVIEETGTLKRNLIDVHFLGIWDTVVAYGLPVDELTQAVDKWVWPMKFRDDSLLPNVQHARQALGLDDERRTFHPIPWNEAAERDLVANKQIAAGRLRQVWFAGMHADVGGGYPDDGLSYVPLCWMIKEAAEKGLRFESSVVAEYYALATPTGRMYDSRSGFGALWRYQPRDAQLLLGEGNTPLVHSSVLTRMTCGNDGYAPISLPEKIDVLLPDGAPVAFDDAAVDQAAKKAATAGEPATPDERRALQEQRRALKETQQLVTLASGQPKRSDLFKLVLDTVWWRRFVYFVSLAFVLIAVAFPLLAQYLRVEGLTDHLNDRAGGPIGWTLGLVKGFLPGVAEPWLTAVVRNPAGAALIVVGLIASLGLSTFLQRRISDRARAAWNVRPKVGGVRLDRLAPTGQRHALAKATIVFIAFAIGARSLSEELWLFYLFAGSAVVFGLWWAFRRYRPAQSVDPADPNAALLIARKARTSKAAVRTYRFVAQKLAPAAFLALSAFLVASLLHRGVFDLLSTGGKYCKATEEVRAESTKKVEAQKTTDQSAKNAEAATQTEMLGRGLDFPTSAMCHATKLRLVAGRMYRIRLDMDAGVDNEWFDKGRRTDVAGFAADGWRHVSASPLKRWWRENWFQPIARIGEVGNYEHVLQPVAPLPILRSNDECPAAKNERQATWANDIVSPAPVGLKQAQIACDNQLGIRPSQVLISDITADATGELFLYVNDAVLTLPGRTSMFYRNNSGTAKVTVARILATTVIETQ